MDNEVNPENIVEQNNFLLYSLIAVIVAMGSYIGYIYTSHDMLQKNDLKEKYILKNDVTFEMLPSYEKSQYMSFYEHSNSVNALKKKLELLQGKNRSDKKPIVVEEEIAVVNIPVEKVVKNEVSIEKTTIKKEIEKKSNQVKKGNNITQSSLELIVNDLDKKDYKTQKSFNTYTCKNMISGKVKIPENCKKDLYKFLDANKKSDLFDVIGMVDKKDFDLINTLRDVYGSKKIKHLAKYSQLGLSKQRASEAIWLMTRKIGKTQKIKTVNYDIFTNDKRGFIIRAYK